MAKFLRIAQWNVNGLAQHKGEVSDLRVSLAVMYRTQTYYPVKLGGNTVSSWIKRVGNEVNDNLHLVERLQMRVD